MYKTIEKQLLEQMSEFYLQIATTEANIRSMSRCEEVVDLESAEHFLALSAALAPSTPFESRYFSSGVDTTTIIQ